MDILVTWCYVEIIWLGRLTMGKYDSLLKTLEMSKAGTMPFTFTQLETILGFELPPSARSYRPWWGNDPKHHSQARAWVAAGYKVANVNLESEQVVFDKIEPTARVEDAHPLFGCLKGTVTITEGVDLTNPADPDWAEQVENPALLNG